MARIPKEKGLAIAADAAFNSRMSPFLRPIRLLTWVLGMAVATPIAAADVQALRLWAGPDYTRAVFDVSGPLDYKVFELDNPPRLVLDVRNAKLGSGFVADTGKGLIGGVRTGKVGERDLRVVFDLGAGVKPKSFLLPPAEQLGHRLVVDIYPRDAAVETAVVRTVEQLKPEGERDVVIAIDAGHGGEDPGARGATGTWEKHITLAVARELAKEIDAQPGMRAVLIRNGDYFIPLDKRYRKAREARADLFVSIHADAFHKQTAAGASVFVLSPRGASSEAARWLAARENASDLVGGVKLDDKDNTLAAVLLDLSQSATLKASEDVANHVLGALKRVGKTHKPQVERANFVVLRSPDVPSMLVETAFISNPGEEKKLNDPVYRKRLAEAIRDGVRDYFHLQPPPGTWLAANPSMRRPNEHVVTRGETLSLIAARHGVTLSSLKSANELRTDLVKVGDRLRIPGVGPG
jgi:N-acetylmuramoyl-L-alanine amidase